jgi:hypothetical protein
MATVGRNAGIAELAGGIQLKGTLAWLIWAAVHVTKLPGLRNRLIAFMNWVYNYLTYDRKARMIVDTIPLNREAGPGGAAALPTAGGDGDDRHHPRVHRRRRVSPPSWDRNAVYRRRRQQRPAAADPCPSRNATWT